MFHARNFACGAALLFAAAPSVAAQTVTPLLPDGSGIPFIKIEDVPLPSQFGDLDFAALTYSGSGSNDSGVSVLVPGAPFPLDVIGGMPSVPSSGGPLGANQVHVVPTITGPTIDLRIYVVVNQALFTDTMLFAFDVNIDDLGVNLLGPNDATYRVRIGNRLAQLGFTDSNPYDITSDAQGRLLICDAGANAILRYNESTDELSVLATIPGVPNDTGVGPPESQAVPTAVINYGNTFLVSTLTGFPFQQGVSTIYELSNDGALTVFAEGLSQVTDIFYDEATDSVYATQFGEWSSTPAPVADTGSLVRVQGGETTVVLEGLNLPTSVSLLTYPSLLGPGSGLQEIIAITSLSGLLGFVGPGGYEYCEGGVNSTGQQATLTQLGTAVVSNDDFGLRAVGLPSSAMGLFLVGTARRNGVFGDGPRCVGGSTLLRFGVGTSGPGGGLSSGPLPTAALNAAGLLDDNSILHFQCFYRDGASMNSSSAMQVMFTSAWF